jgi:hypothetical protein
MLGVAIVILSMGSDGHAAQKKKSTVQMDGAILVVGAVEGPVAALPGVRSRARLHSGPFKTIDGGGIGRRGSNPSMFIARRLRR